MRPAFYLFASDERGLRRRGIALAIVIAVHVLLVLALLMLARSRPPLLPPAETTMTLVPVAAPEPVQEATRKSAEVRAGGSPKAPTPKVTTPAAKPETSAALTGVVPLDIDFDLAKVDPKPAEQPAEVAEVGTDSEVAGKSSGPVYGPVLGSRRGGVPAGETLYKAEWYTEPTNAQLSTYMPARGVPKDAYGIIACRTVPGFRVEDCTELEEGPAGSGISRALRQASWQFRVRPPRIGGRLLVGSWVAIRIDFTEAGPR